MLQLVTLLNTNTIPEKLLRKQQQLTINEAHQLQQTQQKSPSSPIIDQTQTTKKHSAPIDTSKTQEVLDDIRQLARVFHQK